MVLRYTIFLIAAKTHASHTLGKCWAESEKCSVVAEWPHVENENALMWLNAQLFFLFLDDCYDSCFYKIEKFTCYSLSHAGKLML